MKTDFTFVAYLIYLPVVLVLTWYVAHILFNNSKVFMQDIFNGRIEIAASTNRLFETGFYLLNLGFAFLMMEINADIMNGRTMLEVLSSKIGGYCIYLGLMLFFNLYLFFRGKKAARQRARAEAAGLIPHAG